MSLYNILEYSDNYADTTASLYQYKRPKPRDNNGALNNLTANNSSLFKYQSGLIHKQLTTANSVSVDANIDPNFINAHRVWKNIKIVVPLKYISNFFRNLEMLLIDQYKIIHRIELDQIFSVEYHHSNINISNNKR